MTGTGKPLESELSRGLRFYEQSHHDIWYMRWPDFQDFRGAGATKYIPPKAPSDFVALYKGHFYGVECKSTRSKRFVMTWLKDHQKVSLIKIKKAGGVGVILLSTRDRQRAKVRCAFIDIDDYLNLEAVHIIKGKASIDVEELMRIGVKLPRLLVALEGNKTKQVAWDVSPLFNSPISKYV